MVDVDALAQEIRRVDGNHSLGAGQLAEALVPFFEAAIRAAVPEGEPVGVRCTGCGSSWDDDRLAEEKSKRPELISCCPERKIVPLYSRHATRPDMERELAEARAEIERLKYERDVWRSKSNMHQKAAVGRTMAEAALRPFADAVGDEKSDPDDARRPDAWNIWEMSEAMNITLGHLRAARAALSGASIPATADDRWKAPSDRELLHKIEGVLRIPSSGHASANELAETILDAICPGYLGALEWAVERWRDEVQHRPIRNIHRRSLDDAWRQVIRHFGGEDILLCGPAHDDLAALSGASIPAPDKAEARREALEEAAETPQEIFGRWLSDGPRLAKEAGLYVGIKVMPALSTPARREGE